MSSPNDTYHVKIELHYDGATITSEQKEVTKLEIAEAIETFIHEKTVFTGQDRGGREIEIHYLPRGLKDITVTYL